MCAPTSAKTVTSYVIFYFNGDFCINTVIITGFSCSLTELKLPTQPTPPTIYPVIRPHSKHNMSSGCFDAICLRIAMRGKQTITVMGKSIETEIETEKETGQGRDGHTLLSVQVRRENVIFPLCPSTHEHALYPHYVKVTLMELI